jgi:ribosomal protein S18 acetylase RimI-like enzyme
MSAKVAIEVGWRPGIVGAIVRLHALYYARVWNFGPVFEAKVAAGMAAFLERYDPERCRLFAAVGADDIIGALAIDGGEAGMPQGSAHLRWFILAEAARGRGLGLRLMQEAMEFLHEKSFRHCWLDTFAGLDAARALYERHGFRLTREVSATNWGTPVLEQRFEWRAAGENGN